MSVQAMQGAAGTACMRLWPLALTAHTGGPPPCGATRRWTGTGAPLHQGIALRSGVSTVVAMDRQSAYAKLSATEQALVLAAREAAGRSYSPYSHYPVGAAVLCVAPSGPAIFCGCNVENASYGLTVCAERNAMFAAVASGHPRPSALAVACPGGDLSRPSSLMPCGACRQVMAELLAHDAVVLVDGVGRFTSEELLPAAFELG